MRREDRKMVEEFRRRLPGEISEHVRRLIVFGSRARGDASEDADLDLIALVDEDAPEIEKALDDVAYDVMWDYDFKPIISLKVFAESAFDSAVSRGSSFYRNVARQGILL
jgi:uncharacterized protein